MEVVVVVMVAVVEANANSIAHRFNAKQQLIFMSQHKYHYVLQQSITSSVVRMWRIITIHKI